MEQANQGYLSSDLTIYSPLNNASDRYYDNIRVFVNNSNMTLKGLLKQDQSSLKQLNDFRVLRETNTSLSGNPAYDVVYTFTVKDGQQNHKSERITSIINNKSYIILLDSTVEKFDSYVPSLRQIIFHHLKYLIQLRVNIINRY